MSVYKCFFIKTVFFVLLLFICDFIAGIALKKVEAVALDKSPYGMTPEYTLREVNADGIILGSSEALHSYIPRQLEEGLGIKFYNGGLDGTGFYYAAAMIEGVLNRYNPKIILWAVEPNILHALSPSEKDCLSDLAPFYHSNGIANRILEEKSKYEKFKLLSQGYAYNSRLIPYLSKIIIPDFVNYEYGRFNPLSGEIENKEPSKRTWDDNYSPQTREVLEGIIDKCNKEGVRLVFVLTPRYEKGDYRELNTYKKLVDVCITNNIEIIDNLYHDEIILNPHNFRDVAHLNVIGAKMFNERLIELLKKN